MFDPDTITDPEQWTKYKREMRAAIAWDAVSSCWDNWRKSWEPVFPPGWFREKPTKAELRRRRKEHRVWEQVVGE